MTGKLRVGVAIAVGVAVVLSMGATLWLNRPFQAALGSYQTSLADRTEAQRHNIRQAVYALNGVVIEPGQTFSFNELVGPRTPERGYREAPAYMDRGLVSSIGGGICQVSSTLYNAAALAGLAIVERHPHFKRVLSVPPGRDATVWYNASDLRLRNHFSRSVRILLAIDHLSLNARIDGINLDDFQVRLYTYPMANSLHFNTSFKTVREVRRMGASPSIELLSLDVYN